MNALELKVPPPIVAVLCGTLMWWLAKHVPIPMGHTRVAIPVVAVFLLAGVVLDLWAIFTFRRAQTTVNPLSPQFTATIVEAGPYRFTRNPMYLGLACFLFAFAAWLHNAIALVGVLLFMAYITRFQIVPEERILRQKFGTPFDAYCARVRRWL